MKAVKRQRETNPHRPSRQDARDGSNRDVDMHKEKSHDGDARPGCSGSSSDSSSLTLPRKSETFSTKEHTSVTSRTETSDTLELYSRLDELSLQWSTQRGKLRATSKAIMTSPCGDASGFLDDSSLLSLGSCSSLPAADQSSERPSKTVVAIPRRLLDKRGGEFKSIHSLSSHTSVFDRLYEDAKQKAKARRQERDHSRKFVSAHSIGASTITSRHDHTVESVTIASESSSVFERLYRNERQRARQSRTSSADSVAKSSMSALDRRLLYSPPESALPKGYRQRPAYGSRSARSTTYQRTPSSPRSRRTAMPQRTGGRSPTEPISPLTPASVLQRRLQYKPPDSAIPRRAGRIVAPRLPLFSPGSSPLEHSASRSASGRVFLSKDVESSLVMEEEVGMSSEVDFKNEAKLDAVLPVPLVLERLPRSSKLAKPVETTINNKQSLAAARIINWWKRCQERRVFRKTDVSAICIQRSFRRHLSENRRAILRSHQVDECTGSDYVESVLLRTDVDADMTGYTGRMSDNSVALLLQSRWRMCVIRRKYLRKKESAIAVQSWRRKLHCRRVFLEMRSAACVIQHAWRGHCSGDKSRRRKMMIRIAHAWRDSEMIQANYDLGRHAILAETDAPSSFSDHLESAALKIQARWRLNAFIRRLHLEADTVSLAGSTDSAPSISSKNSVSYSAPGSAPCDSETWRQTPLMSSNGNLSASPHGSARSIQMAWRQSHARLKLKNSSAVVIQSFVRMAFRRQKYIALLASARVIQRSMRVARSRRSAMDLIETTQHERNERASICIQSSWRRFSAREQLASWRRAAIVAQSVARRVRCERQYKTMHVVAVWTQRYFRKRRANRLTAFNAAALTIQTFWRWQVAQRRTVVSMKAIVRIQAMARMMLDHKRYLRSLKYAVLIQSQMRGLVGRRLHLCRQAERFNFAARQIQWAYREFRSSSSRRVAFATSIQCLWRCYTARRSFTYRRRAAVLIQAVIRQQSRRRRAVAIQRLWRCMNVHSKFIAMRFAAIKIQSVFRTMVRRREFSIMLRAVRTIQSHARDYVKRRCAVDSSGLRVSRFPSRPIILIQSAWRTALVSSWYRRCRVAAVVIQSAVRRSSCHLAYRRALLAVVVSQRYARKRIARRQCELIRAANRIQSAWRGATGRCRYVRVRVAAVLLQSIIRMASQQRKHRILRSATISIQRQYRRRICHLRSEYLQQEIRMAAIALQSVWRMSIARCEYLHAQAAVLLLQSHGRRLIASRYYRQRVSMHRQACLIQGTWRDYRHRALRHLYAIHIQCSWRGCVVRLNQLRVGAAIVMQSTWRGFWERKLFTRKIHCATAIQSFWRRCKTLSSYSSARGAAVIVQALVRRALTRQIYLKCKASGVMGATCLQCAWRRYSKLAAYSAARGAVISIQSVFRMYLGRRRYLTSRTCVLVIQCIVRRRQLTARVVRRKSTRDKAASTIQNRWRAHRQVLQCQRRLSANVIVIQAHWRSSSARSRYSHIRSCAILIQAAVRLLQERRRFVSQRVAAIHLQSWHRGVVERRFVLACLRELETTNSSALRIQTVWRSFITRQAEDAAARVIQNYARSAQARRADAEANNAACSVQTTARRYLARRFLQRSRWAAVRIQSTCRGRKARSCLANVRSFCIKLQAFIRGAQTRIRMKRELKATVRLQAFMRRCLSRIRIANFRFYSRAMHFTLDKLMTGVELLQAMHHGRISQTSSFLALLMINLCLQSSAAAAFISLASRTGRFPPILVSWLDGVAQAQGAVAVTIQRAYRQHLHKRSRFVASAMKERRLANNMDVIVVGRNEDGYPIVRLRRPSAPFIIDSVGKPNRCRVSVVGSKMLDNDRLLVEFAHESFIKEDTAARLLQSFARKFVLGQAKGVRRRLLWQLDESANEAVEQIMAGTRLASAYGPCVHRVADRAKQAVLMGAWEAEFTRTLAAQQKNSHPLSSPRAQLSGLLANKRC